MNTSRCSCIGRINKSKHKYYYISDGNRIIYIFRVAIKCSESLSSFWKISTISRLIKSKLPYSELVAQFCVKILQRIISIHNTNEWFFRTFRFFPRKIGSRINFAREPFSDIIPYIMGATERVCGVLCVVCAVRLEEASHFSHLIRTNWAVQSSNRWGYW